VVVACIVFHLRHAEHLELGRKPAADDVESKTPSGLFCGHDGMDRWNVRRRQNTNVLGPLTESCRPGVSFEVGSIEVTFAAETAPACDRNHGLVSVLVRRLSDRQVCRPRHSVPVFGGGNGATIADIDPKEAELELVVVE
jgi:hypothetical protein